MFERVNVGEGHVNIVLKKHRKLKSTEFERSLSPTLAAIPDARVSFQSQQGGGPDGDSRDIMLYLGGEDPVQLTAVANQIAKEMETVPGLRAPRVGSNLAQPEITIKPRFDLAADLGVTTAALSQTIRIATLGDIEQNSAKFSLSDRQVPIQVSLSENARRDISTLENLPVPTSSGGSVPLKAVAEIGFGSGPTTIQRSNQLRRLAIGADLAPGVVEGDVWAKVNQLPAVKNLPQGVQKMNLGNQKWQSELLFNFAVALISGVLLVFAVLVLLYRRFLAPFVNMGSLILAPLGRRGRAAHRRPAGLAVRADRHPDAVRDRRQELDPAGRFRGRDDEPRHGQERGDLGSRAQARPADRHDDGGDGRRHAADRDFAQRRQQLARADGHHRHRRPDLLDRADAAPGAVLFLDRHLDRIADRQAVPPLDRHRGASRPGMPFLRSDRGLVNPRRLGY